MKTGTEANTNFHDGLRSVYIQESAENGEDLDGKWRDALMWKVF